MFQRLGRYPISIYVFPDPILFLAGLKPSWEYGGVVDNGIMDVELLDIYDRYYARQAVVDNGINRRSHELLQVIEKLRGEFDVIRDREKDREEECEGLRVKCEAAMTEFEKNPAVVALRKKIYALSTEVTSLEAKKARLEAVEVSLRKEVEELKQDRLVSSAILYRMCKAYEQVANMKEPFDLSKVKGDENPIRTLGDYLKPSHEGYKNTIELPIRNNVNEPRDFAKPVKVIALLEDVPSTSDCCLIKFKNQVQCLMEAHLAPTQPTQVNKITTLCEIYSGPHDTQYCMENPEQAFVEYASSRTDEVG
nr:MAK10-like protein [Tanacetum cinerariifolium]